MPGRDRARGLDAIAFGLDEMIASSLRSEPCSVDPDYWPAYFTDSARRGVPLPVQRGVVDFCVTNVLRSAWAEVGDDDATDLMTLTSVASDHQRQVRRHASEAYHRFYADFGQHERSRQLRADELLEGHLADDRTPWLVVVVPAGAAAHPAMLRTTRPVGTVLLAPPMPTRSATEDQVRHLLAESGTSPTPLSGACWAAGGADVPVAFREAVRTTRVAGALPAAQSLVLPGQVVLERHLASDPTLSTALSGPLVALAAAPDLMMSLQALIQCDLDRTATAATLHINRRTLTHRLNRIAALTGFDPRTARGLQVLANAMSASRLASG